MKKTCVLLLILILTSGVLTACTSDTALLRAFKPAAPGDILYIDDFSNQRSGWGMMDRAGGDIEIKYGGMLFTINLPNFMFWSITGGDYTDAHVEVDAVLVEGSVDDAFGVICRYRDEDNFYGFMISHDGYYGIFKYLDGAMVMATEDGKLGYSEDIRQGGAVNHIMAVCQGNTLSLIVNESTLAVVVDESFLKGKVGLLAGSYSKPSVTVLFDNFKVVQP